MTLPKSPLVLGALALAVYFLFIKKSAPAAAPAAGAPLSSPASTPYQGVIDAAASTASELLELGAGAAKESMAGYGATPATLNGVVASVGGFGDLGGSFYGSY